VDQYTRDNWEKIKTHLEAVGQTNNMFYKRAQAIINDQSDPLKHPSLTTEDQEES